MKNDTRFTPYYTYVMEAYVDFISAAGARIVPLIVGEPEDVTLSKLKKLNGVFMPGGDGDYVEYGRFIYNKIKEFND